MKGCIGNKWVKGLYLGPCQIVNGENRLTIFPESVIIDILQGPKCTSGLH